MYILSLLNFESGLVKPGVGVGHMEECVFVVPGLLNVRNALDMK